MAATGPDQTRHAYDMSARHGLMSGPRRILQSGLARKLYDAGTPPGLVERILADVYAKENEPFRSVVYFLVAHIPHQVVKIGWTGDYSRRLQTLQASYPCHLMEAGTVAGGRLLEHGLHLACADHRINGEWFNMDPWIEDLILSVSSMQLEHDHNWLNGIAEHAITESADHNSGPTS